MGRQMPALGRAPRLGTARAEMSKPASCLRVSPSSSCLEPRGTWVTWGTASEGVAGGRTLKGEEGSAGGQEDPVGRAGTAQGVVRALQLPRDRCPRGGDPSETLRSQLPAGSTTRVV